VLSPLRSLAARRWAEDRSQDGLVLVWMSLTLTLMLLFAGFAVDMSNWWLQAQRIQTAADAGAHAGAAFLPADFTNARSKATSETGRNGYTTGGSDNQVVTVNPVLKTQNWIKPKDTELFWELKPKPAAINQICWVGWCQSTSIPVPKS
jgi:Flp pilus assembly protein TadG